jgi:aryl-alcohol dehydrogenase-like predicted oxidoreductase
MSTLENQSDTFDIGGDLTVHRLGFGAMRITGEGVLGEPDDAGETKGVLRCAVDLGVDLIDTADSYGPGTSERLLREALHPYSGDLTIATKGGLLRTLDGDWLPHGDPDYLENALQCSLDRLGVGSIDLYQFHRPDPDTPFEESVHRLAELRDRGLIRHVGLSNVSVEQLEAAREIVEIATVQNRYNVAFRDHEDVLEACSDHGIGFIPWYPLGGGDLGEKSGALGEVAANHDATRQQVALAWLLSHADVILPIPGTGNVEHLEANVAATRVDLADAEYRRLAA